MAIEQITGRRFGKIGILIGGPSSEREISLKSGKAVYKSLKQAGNKAIAIDIKTDNRVENIRLLKKHNLNCAFIALHGCFGEDGTIQKILEELEIPYTGSGVQASRLAMDKIASRKIFEVYGLSVPKYKIADKSNSSVNLKTQNHFSFPLVIKPSRHGSSLGLSIVDKPAQLNQALDLAFGFDEKILVEEFIAGREVTVGILDEKALPVIEIIPKRRFFDYTAKYRRGMTHYCVPARLKKDISKRIQDVALSAHKLLGCSGCSRVDMILGKDEIPFVLEVNTIPGLTKTSLLPKAAERIGIGFTQLCLKLLELAYEKKHYPSFTG